MALYIILIVALVVNFFGGQILSVLFVGADVVGVPANDYYVASNIEMGIVLAICASIFIKFGSKLSSKKLSDCRYESTHNRLGVVVLEVILIGLALWAISGVDWGFSAQSRGVNQFNRSIDTALSRFTLVGLFVLSVYLNSLGLSRRSIVVSALYSVCLVLNQISLGDRRLAVYVCLIILSRMIFSHYESNSRRSFFRSKSVLVGAAAFAIISFLSYAIRSSGASVEFGAGEGAARAILTSIGYPGILWKVKEYVENTTGYMLGQTIFPSLHTLVIPSVFLYMMGEGESVQRGSLIFDGMFNDNPNMGYDFMLLADLYWNFGWFGYALFILASLWIAGSIYKFAVSGTVFGRSMVPLLMIAFVSSLRSDTIFFVKSVLMSYVATTILTIVVNPSLKRAGEGFDNN